MNKEINYEKFVKELRTKDAFMLDWLEGAVLPVNHPNYYVGRVDVSIRKIGNKAYGTIKIQKEEYELSQENFKEIYNLIEKNIKRLIKITLSQNNENYNDVYDNIIIKYKSVYVDIRKSNITKDSDFKFVKKLEDKIRNIILSSDKAE